MLDQNLSTSHSLKNKKKRKSNLDCYRTLSLSPNSTQQAEQLFLPAEKYDPLLDLSGKGYIVPDITFSFWEGRLGLIQLLLLPRRFNLSKDREFQNSATNLIRSAFSEWEGRECCVTFHKGWKSLCGYVSKKDKNPYVWGKFPLSEIVQEANLKSHRKTSTAPRDPEVAELLLSNYNSLRNLWEDSQRIKMREISPMEILLDYNERKGRPVLRELFVYGKPNTQKTLLRSLLKKIGLRIYVVGQRGKDYDYVGAHDFFDFWVIDEFIEEKEYSGEQPSSGGRALHALLGRSAG
ncbi:hypothetical protein E5676_scaffold80748G00030 [Cucumis melo var. makuwa]|uniref:Uncharacterized protein n=1 Tax=Cucumis melo var. makuwa TaxID=1194695 RepID=A0A5A7TZF5_CUCMM|nr:hypothetical protein E6C27_scaffold45781G00030 [Cucumis melo var. makuwa]TYK24193.1 hypothetical protein E5676_scaffold80748G00030 [Cucumis melo var. makuwa]